MFSADVGHLQATLSERPHRDSHSRDTYDYLLPSLVLHPPWSPKCVGHSSRTMGDFILIAEFSEQEGPRPVICIPKDGGEWFDKNDFSVKILSVDYQSSFTDNITEDAQVVMSDAENQAYSFVHHLVLNDIQARGYVRPFCIAYVTADSSKIMKIYAELSKQLKMATRQMKYGNRLVFMRDLEKHLEDLSYTKAHLLITQSRSQGTSQSDNDLLAALNNIRQSMEEVKEIISSLQPLLNDKELEEKFEQFEVQSKVQRRRTESGSGSLNDCDTHTEHEQIELSGSFNNRPSQEFSLFSKNKDLKPKLIDVSALRGKRRFDRSLRGLHSLCSWGAKEGLQRLRVVQEFLKRDRSSIQLDDINEAIISPDSGLLSFGQSTLGANFLSPHHWQSTICCHTRGTSMHPSHGHMSSFCSVDSFQSFPSSFGSFLDEETMYSAQSSVVDTSIPSFNRQISTSTIDTCQTANESNIVDIACELDEMSNLDGESLIETLTNEKSDDSKMRSVTGHSDFVDIDKDKDLKCKVDNCPCSVNVVTTEGQTSEVSCCPSVVNKSKIDQGVHPNVKDTTEVADNSSKAITEVGKTDKDVSGVQAESLAVSDANSEEDESPPSFTDVCDEGVPILLASPASNDDTTDTSPSESEKVEGKHMSKCAIYDDDKKELSIEVEGDSEQLSATSLKGQVTGDKTEIVYMKPGIFQGRSKVITPESIPDNGTVSASETKLAASRRRRIFHQADSSEVALGACLLRLLCSFNHMQHLVYSILSGRPVVVMATRRHEAAVHEMIHALNVFIPFVPSSSPATVIDCVQLKLPDIPRFSVRGLIREDKKPVDYLVSASVRRYITLLDMDKMLLYSQPYQGSLLSYIPAIYDKKKAFISEESVIPYIQMKLQEISLQAYNFYHCISGGESDLDYSGVHVPRKSAMLALTSKKYFSECGIHSCDGKIIKHLVEVVKIQQIEEEYQSRYLTDSPVLPLCVSYQPTMTYKLS